MNFCFIPLLEKEERFVVARLYEVWGGGTGGRSSKAQTSNYKIRNY